MKLFNKFRRFFVFTFVFVFSISQLLSYFVYPAYAASPWSQTDWSSGVGASTSNQYSSGSNIDATTTAGQVTLGLNVGTGADGAITVSSTKTIDTDTIATGRSYADAASFNIATSISAGATTINVGATPNGLVVGDEILIINLRGTSGDYANVGKYETRYITSIATNTLTLDNALANTYDGTTQKIMVQRVPQYTNVTVSSGGTLTVGAYNNTTGKGGVLFFRANGTVTVDSGGTISASGKGFAGGAGSAVQGPGSGGITYNGTGGNGVQWPNTGLSGQGGGGGGVGSGGTGTIGGAGGGGGDYVGGGGGGGYGTVGTGATGNSCNGNTTGSSGSGTTGGNGGIANAGGGGTYGSSNLSTLFLGSGGGGAHRHSSGTSGSGGNGGGILLVSTNSMTVSGSVSANGSDGGNATGNGGGGGGGSGGSLNLKSSSSTLGTSLVTSSGGVGGGNGNSCSAIPGLGHGGSGRIAIASPNAISGTTSPTYATGVVEYASSSTLTSNIFDTSQLSEWGILSYSATTPTNTTITVKARTSNDSGMSGATAFSSCTAITSGSDISGNSCITDGHRYIQYLVTLATTDTSVTSTFSDITINYTPFDTSAPSISLTALSPDPNNDNTPTLTGTATDTTSTVSAVQFQMDGTSGSWTACSASDGSFNSNSEAFTCTTSALSDGSHTMNVRATDSLSNTTANGSVTTDTFTIDTLAPVLTLTAITPDPGTDNTPTIVGTATDATTVLTAIQYQIDSTSGSWTTCIADDTAIDETSETFSCTPSALSDGSHTIYVRATDNASNTSSNASDSFSIDTTNPSKVDLDNPDDKKYLNDDNVTFKWNASTDATSGIKEYKLYLDDTLIKTTTDTEYEYDTGEGKHSWYVTTVDNVGNEKASDANVFYVDKTGPKITKVSIDGNEISNNSDYLLNNLTPTITIYADDPNKDDSESGVEKIEIEVQEKGLFGDKIIETGIKSTDNGKTSTKLSNLKRGKTYKILLQVIDNVENKEGQYEFEIDIKLLAQKLDLTAVNDTPSVVTDDKKDEATVEIAKNKQETS